MNKQRIRISNRPQAFWGSVIPSLISSTISTVGGLITTSAQARAQKRALEQQQELARQQAQITRDNQLASTLNNAASANDSYANSENYDLKYRIGGVKHLGNNNISITDGGNAKKIGNNTYLLRGGSHEDINETGQTGIGINVGGNQIEAEGGEVAQRKGNSLRIYSAQPILGGVSPAQAVMRGYNKDAVFNAQQRFKKVNGIKDDGRKAELGTNDYINAAKTVSSYLPVIGTIQDAYEFYKHPSIEQGAWTVLRAMGDLAGAGSIIRGAKLFRNAKRAYEVNKNIINARKMINAKNAYDKSKVYSTLVPGADNVIQNFIDKSKRYGGLTSKDRGSSIHPYPNVSVDDFAGANRTYPIPTKSDAIDALRLAGLHGRSDIRSKIYNKYPELRKKAKIGTKVESVDNPYHIYESDKSFLTPISNWSAKNRKNNILASILYESGLVDPSAYKPMLRDIYQLTGMGSDPDNTENNVDAVALPMFRGTSPAKIEQFVKDASEVRQTAINSQNREVAKHTIKSIKDYYNNLGIKVPVGKSKALYNPTYKSEELMTPILAKNMTNGANPFLYTSSSVGNRVINTIKRSMDVSRQKLTNVLPDTNFKTSEQLKSGLSRGIANIKAKGNDVRNTIKEKINTTKDGIKEGIKNKFKSSNNANNYKNFIPNPNQSINDKLKKALFWTTGAGTAASGFKLATEFIPTNKSKSNNKTKSNTQLDAHGKPISQYIAKPTETSNSNNKQSNNTNSKNKQNNNSKPNTNSKQSNKSDIISGFHDNQTKNINNRVYVRRGNSIFDTTLKIRYDYDENGKYKGNKIYGEGDYSRVGDNFNDAFDEARGNGAKTFKYNAGKYNRYTTDKETDEKKEAQNRRYGSRRIAKRFGGYSLPIRGMRPKALIGTNTYYLNDQINPPYNKTNANLQSLANIHYNSMMNNPITGFTPTISNPIVYKGPSLIDNDYDVNGSFNVNNNSNTIFKPGDYVGLGIDTLSALGSMIIGNSAYDNLNYNYALPSYVDESPVAFDTTYHNEAQRAAVERNRLNTRNLIKGNTSSAQTSLSRMQKADVDALTETNKLFDEKSNKEVELRNQAAANEQNVRARNAAAKNNYFNQVAQIKNAAIAAQNANSMAKAQNISTNLSGLSKAWTNFYTAGRSAFEDNQSRIAAIAASDKGSLARMLNMGYTFDDSQLAKFYNGETNPNTKRLILSRMSPSYKKRIIFK